MSSRTAARRTELAGCSPRPSRGVIDAKIRDAAYGVFTSYGALGRSGPSSRRLYTREVDRRGRRCESERAAGPAFWRRLGRVSRRSPAGVPETLVLARVSQRSEA